MRKGVPVHQSFLTLFQEAVKEQYHNAYQQLHQVQRTSLSIKHLINFECNADSYLANEITRRIIIIQHLTRHSSASFVWNWSPFSPPQNDPI